MQWFYSYLNGIAYLQWHLFGLCTVIYIVDLLYHSKFTILTQRLTYFRGLHVDFTNLR